MRSILGLVVIAVLVAGCAGGGGTQARPRENLKVLTGEQIEALNVSTLYDAVRRLRPEWLTERGVSANVLDPNPITTANVYMNGSNQGTVDVMREMSSLGIAELRYYTASEASAKFGMGNPRGVIEITRR